MLWHMAGKAHSGAKGRSFMDGSLVNYLERHFMAYGKALRAGNWVLEAKNPAEAGFSN